MTFTETLDLDGFNAKLASSPYKHFLTLHTQDEVDQAGTRMFVSWAGSTLFAVTDGGEIQNVAALPGAPPGAGRLAVEEAIRLGGHRLDCYDGWLAGYYADLGFEVVDRMAWADEYAQDGWDFDRFGRPDVVIMAIRQPSLDTDVVRV